MDNKFHVYDRYFGKEGLLNIINHCFYQKENKFENLKNEEIENLYCIKNNLIRDFCFENISYTDLEKYIENYENSFGAGLVTTVRCSVSKDNKDLVRAKKIGLEQEFGFLAYEGKEINNLYKKQGWFSFLESAEDCSGNSMFRANIKNAKYFEGSSGENAIVENAISCFGLSFRNSNITNAGDFREQSGRYATVNLAVGCVETSLFKAKVKYALRCKERSLNQAEIQYGKDLGKKVVKNAKIKYYSNNFLTKLNWKFNGDPFEEIEIKKTYENILKSF